MKLIPLSQGQFAMVDDEDYDHLMQWKWCATKNNVGGGYYACRTTYKRGEKRIRISMHRDLTNAKDGMDVDHKDGNPLNNQKSNLRVCTRSENTRNRKRRKNGTSEYHGVYVETNKREWGGKTIVYKYWTAKITNSDGKYRRIGYFKTQKEAALAYNEAAKVHHGEFARLNIIKD